MSDNVRQHYYFAGCELTILKRAIEHKRKLNCLIILDSPLLTQRVLGHIQQNVQIRYYREIEQPSPDMQVTDVYIESITHLGHMTKEEFLELPTEPEVKAPEVTPEATKEQLFKKDEFEKLMAEKDLMANAPPEPIEAPTKAEEASPVKEHVPLDIPPPDAPIPPETTPSTTEHGKASPEDKANGWDDGSTPA